MTEEPLAALKAGDWLDFAHNKVPKCPHCGHDCEFEKTEWWQLYSNDDDSHDVECPSCDQPFAVKTVVTCKFSTDEQEPK